MNDSCMTKHSHLCPFIMRRDRVIASLAPIVGFSAMMYGTRK